MSIKAYRHLNVYLIYSYVDILFALVNKAHGNTQENALLLCLICDQIDTWALTF